MHVAEMKETPVTPQVIEPIKATPEVEWFLCPTCKGLGEVPSDEIRRLLRGVMHIRHVICPTCNGAKMVKSGTFDLNEVEGTLYPIKQCRFCKNWFAWGAGKPKRIPCPHVHTDESHCHWHDQGAEPPGRVNAPNVVKPGEPV